MLRKKNIKQKESKNGYKRIRQNFVLFIEKVNIKELKFRLAENRSM